MAEKVVFMYLEYICKNNERKKGYDFEKRVHTRCLKKGKGEM